MQSNLIAIDLAKNIFQVVKCQGLQRLVVFEYGPITAIEFPSFLGTRQYLAVDKNLLT